MRGKARTEIAYVGVAIFITVFLLAGMLYLTHKSFTMFSLALSANADEVPESLLYGAGGARTSAAGPRLQPAWAQEGVAFDRELGRLNVALAPSHVIDRSLATAANVVVQRGQGREVASGGVPGAGAQEVVREVVREVEVGAAVKGLTHTHLK